MASAATLLAGAMSGGDDGLSPRDCWICIAYLYAGGKTATKQLALAMANGYDELSPEDVKKCIAEVLSP
jgi:hypothetical protein